MVLVARKEVATIDLQASMQTSLFGAGQLSCSPRLTQSPQPLDDRSSTLFEPGWLRGSDVVFEQLRTEMPWRSMERPMYDRVVAVPRLICTVRPAAYASDHPLVQITTALEQALQCQFDSVGLNYYRTGQDSVAWHRDSIGRTAVPTTVALVSMGSPRTLAIRRYRAPPRPALSSTAGAPSTTPVTATQAPRSTPATGRRWRLGHGDLFVMHGACQHDWEHCVPKERGVGARISLAFRCNKAAGGPQNSPRGVPSL